MKKNIKIGLLALSIFSLSACNDGYLEKFPETDITKENFFKSENDLEMYILNLYNFGSVNIYEADATTDNASTTGNKEIKNVMLGNASAATITTGWDWGALRNINFFLENLSQAQIAENRLKHYEGLARYFRARFYVEKIQRFSDVPWVDKVVNTTDEETLMGERDPRDFVVQKILEDFEYAAEHVSDQKQSGAVNKWVVLQEYSRFALYEGTFRKYHDELNLQNTASDFLTIAVEKSNQIIQSGQFAIHNTGKPESDYASLFFNENLEDNKEVILGRFYANTVINGSSWPGMFGNYEYYPLRDLVQTYLMKDGSFYTSQSGYDKFGFVEEFKDRDPRLSQTYAAPGWTLIYSHTYAQGAGLYVQQLAKNFSGYHQIKGFMNTLSLEQRNNIDIPLYRYAEVLLTYAEAKAELGSLTQADLDATINVLRSRVDMPHMSLSQPLDPTIANDYPNVTGAQKNLILEIRRERRVELAFEGYRFNDLMRWKAGKLLEKKPQGIYFDSLGNHDLTGDNIPDIKLIGYAESIPEEREKNSLGEPLRYYRVGKIGQDASVFLSDGNSGYIDVVDDAGEFIEPKYYYRPVPANDVFLNPNLTQVFGW